MMLNDVMQNVMYRNWIQESYLTAYRDTVCHLENQGFNSFLIYSNPRVILPH